jgi:hypothetical protein
MNWLQIAIGTFFAVGVAILITWSTRRSARVKSNKQPSYCEVKTDRDTLFFNFVFVVFWILMVAPKVDWSFAGEFTGFVFAILFAAVGMVSRFVFRRLGHTNPHE